MSRHYLPKENLSYEDRQRIRDRQYLESWKRLPARKRKQLEAVGLGPALPDYRTAKPDVTGSLERATSRDPEPEEPAPVVNFQLDAEVLIAAYRRLVGEIVSCDKAALTIDCLALVTNIAYDGSTQVEIAERHGVTRAAVSKRCTQLTDALGLPPSRAMRALTVRDAYAERAHQSHQRSA
ncbi:MAG: hypothetical protein Q7P63_01245 [Verrucomicrobiota bacterium JB022]|nr:hypothetical protein [Verrucomicrobiota bacterium JB022]